MPRWTSGSYDVSSVMIDDTTSHNESEYYHWTSKSVYGLSGRYEMSHSPPAGIDLITPSIRLVK